MVSKLRFIWYSVDGKSTMQGLMVKQPKEDGGFSTSVLKLQTLSNMDCEPAELAELLAAMARADLSGLFPRNRSFRNHA